MPRLSKRDDVIKAAARLIADHGLKAVSVRDIAQAAGVRAASVYRLFEGKEQIFDAVLHYAWNEAGARRTFLQSAAPAERKAKTILYLAIREMDDLEIVTKILQRALVDEDMDTLVAYKHYQSGRIAHIQAAFQELSGDRDGQLLMNLALGAVYGYMDLRPFLGLVRPLSRKEVDPAFLSEIILGMLFPGTDWAAVELLD